MEPKLMHYEPGVFGVHFWAENETRAHLDVRELLEEGGAPYAIIMECVQMLAATQQLVVHAIMQPRPLRIQLERMGYAVEVRHTGPDDWELEVTV